MIKAYQSKAEYSASTKEHTVVGGMPLAFGTTDRDDQYMGLWKSYEPKVRVMARQFSATGMVGAEQEDLVQIAQTMLLHALRKYDPSKARFSTYYYNCLRNEYFHLKVRCFPKRRYQVIAKDNARKDEAGYKGKLLKCTGGELEAVLMTLRSTGHTYEIIATSRKTRYPLMETMESLDKDFNLDNRDGGDLNDTLASPTDPLTEEEVLKRVEDCVLDEKLRSIALWLFAGHKMSDCPCEEKDCGGIQKRLGLDKHKAERDLHRIRMILAGEFGMKYEGAEPIAPSEMPVLEDTKNCVRCGQDKPIGEFPKRADGAKRTLTVRPYCKPCQKHKKEVAS